jgi:hypothetical protein
MVTVTNPIRGKSRKMPPVRRRDAHDAHGGENRPNALRPKKKKD